MVGLGIIGLWILLRGNELIPGRWQLVMEGIYINIKRVVYENLGGSGERYFPIICSIFILVVLLNILGLFPYVFTVTAHIAITMGLSVSIIVGIVLQGMVRHGGKFLSIMMPGGAPLVLGPMLVLIETLSFITRGISLGVRLAANISAGHILFGILSGFVFDLLLNGTMILSILCVLVMVFVTLLEMMVAIIQAYVFCLLITIYLRDVL